MWCGSGGLIDAGLAVERGWRADVETVLVSPSDRKLGLS